MRGVYLIHPELASFLCGEPLLHIPCWLPFLSGRFLLHIPCWLYFSLGSFSHTSHACFRFLWEVSLTHPVLASYLCGSFSYTSRMGFIFILGVSLTHPCLLFVAWGMGGGGVLHIPCFFFSCFFSSSFFFAFSCGEFLLDILLGWLYLYLGSFSYTSRAGFPFLWAVSLTHPMLSSFLSGEFLLHIPCWLSFSVGRFSYTSHDDFVFIWEVSLTHPVLPSVLSGKFVLNIPYWFLFCP